MNNTPADLFELYLKTGVGGKPMIVDYEKSAIDFANFGAGIGLVSGAVNYYRENGTLDGSTDYILESATGGMYCGSKTGAGVGFVSGAINLIANPEGHLTISQEKVLKNYRTVQDTKNMILILMCVVKIEAQNVL